MTQVITWERAGAASGVVAVLLLLVSRLVGDVGGAIPPEVPSSVIAEVLEANRWRVLVGSYLAVLGAFALVWFAGYVRQAAGTATRGGRAWLQDVAFGGGLAAAVLFLVPVHVAQAAAVLDRYGTESQVAKAVFLSGWNRTFAVEAPALAAMVGALAIAGIRTGGLPRWLSWSGLAVAVLLLTPVVPGGPVVLALAWIGTLAAVLFVRSLTAGDGSEEGAQATDAAEVPEATQAAAEPAASPGPEPSMPEPSMPEPSMPEPSMPEPSMPEPSMPEPSMPEPSMPEPSMPEPRQAEEPATPLPGPPPSP